MSDSLGDRIKRYEAASHYTLPPRQCLFIRVDGRAFHTFTRGFARPFDDVLIEAMRSAAYNTAKEMQGFKGAYIQSDECTFMLSDFDEQTSQGWFGYDLAKVISISASLFTGWFNNFLGGHAPSGQLANFDSRAFVVPQEDAANVFVWRQKDWARNSLQMLARSYFSHKALLGKGHAQIHEMLYSKGVNWADLEPVYKNGRFLFRGLTSTNELSYEWINQALWYPDLFPLTLAERDESRGLATLS